MSPGEIESEIRTGNISKLFLPQYPGEENLEQIQEKHSDLPNLEDISKLFLISDQPTIKLAPLAFSLLAPVLSL